MIKVLFVGNSFTFFHDMPAMVQNLANYDRDRIHTVKLTYGGYRLAQYLEEGTEPNRRLESFLSSEKWDFVVIHDQSCTPTVAPDSFFAAAEALCKKIRDAGAKPVFYATWGYRNRCGKQSRLGELKLSYEEFCERQKNAYEKAARDNHAGIVKVCNGFRLADEEGYYDHIIRSQVDDYHPMPGGSYIAAVMFARYFFGDTLSPLWKPEKYRVEPELAEKLADIALRAESDPPLNL